MIADLGDSAERESAIGQALVTAADGVVTAEVRAVFEKALGLDPAFAEARFFIALAAEQDGDMPKAAALLAETPADAPWRPAVAQHLAAATGMPGPGATPPPAAMASPMPAASGDAAAAIAALPADQRLQAIRGMVDGLAARLARNGRDIAGLLRLVKAHTIFCYAELVRSARRDARARALRAMPRPSAGSMPRRTTSDWKADVTRKGRRLAIIGTAGSVLAVAVALVLVALRDNIVFFYGPTELVEKAPAPGTRLRIGGLVEKGTLVHEGNNAIHFAVTDLKSHVTVTYAGLLPDLFREGQGVVAECVLTRPGVFAADTVLAKHDATYMPKNVADTLRKQGVWRGDETSASAGAPAVQ